MNVVSLNLQMGELMKGFLRDLETQRWDDHRYYHHSLVNQSLHFLSAVSFLCSYVLLFTNPAAAGLVGWLIAMISRQVGHFYFEPRGYDEVNQATHEYKEAIKVGYNLKRKIVLLGVWAVSPVAVYLDPTLLGIFEPHFGFAGFLYQLSVLWIVIGLGGLAFRTVQLFFLKDVQTGLVWLTKILTDPFHDIKLYHRAPLRLLRGELIDPGTPRQHA